MDVTRGGRLGASGLIVLFSAALVWGSPVDSATSTVLTSADGFAGREAGVSPQDVSAGGLGALPAVTQVRQYLPDGYAGAGGAAAAQIVEDPDPMYSNTLGQNLFSPEMAGLAIADDLLTEATEPCALTTLKVRVNGGVEGGGGLLSVDVSLWEACPYGGGELIPGTESTFSDLPDDLAQTAELVMHFDDRGICADDSPCLVSQQDCADASVCEPDPLIIPPEIWLQLRFSTATAGVIVGTPAQRGYSADLFDHPYAPCVAWFNGYPAHPHASFWVELYGDEFCQRQHLTYLAADPTAPAWIPPGDAQVRVADDIELIYGPNDNTICSLSAFELGIKGNAGPYDMEIALTWRLTNDEEDPEHCGQPDSMCARTTRVFHGRGEGSLEVARFDITDEDLNIGPNDQPIYIMWKPNRGSTGVPNVMTTMAGRSLPVFFIQDFGGNQGWGAYVIPTGTPAVFYSAVYCKGDPPHGACCPAQPAGPGAEVVCYDDVTVLGCLGSRWLINSTCEDNMFNPPCGTHACCKPDDNCLDLTYDNCVAICDTDLDPIACRDDDDCPGLRVCHEKECHDGWDYTGTECVTADDCEPGETCADFAPDPGRCSRSCSRWASREYCGEGEQECYIFECYDAAGDCFAVDEAIGCDDDFDCPPGRHCLLPGHICSARLGCGNLRCCDAVCRDPWGGYCCEVGWDDTCVSLAINNCEIPPGNDVCWSDQEDEGAFEIGLEDVGGGPCTAQSAWCEGHASAPNSYATTDPDDGTFCCATAGADSTTGLGTLWYRFTPAHSSARIHTCSSGGWAGQDTMLQVFRLDDPDLGRCDDGTACSLDAQDCADGSDCELNEQAACESLIVVGCNDDYPVCGPEDFNSSICVTGLVPGEVYYIEMASPNGFNLGGYDIDLESPCPPSHVPPVNSECEGAWPIFEPGVDFSLEGASFDCPSEPTLPMMTNDIWYEYNAECTGNLTVQTCSADMPEGENPDTTLAVYQWGLSATCPPDPEDLMGSNDDATIEKHCTIDRKTCNEDADCIIGCTGPGPHQGWYCEEDEDCPGTSTCDTSPQRACSITGDLCTEDADCHLGVCEDDLETECQTDDTSMHCQYAPDQPCATHEDCLGTCTVSGVPCELPYDCPQYPSETCDGYQGTCDPFCGRDQLGDPWECIPVETCETGECVSDCAPASSVTVPVFPGSLYLIRLGGKSGSYPEGFLSVDCVADDCNLNGFPDVWEIEQGWESDCNLNGQPDVCDIDPADPDGNGAVSADCDGNDIPDECQIAWNAIVDCDIVPPPCYEGPFFCYVWPCDPDVDQNGIPDGCMVARPIIPGPPDDAVKNRYVSFDPNNPGSEVAFRVDLTASTYFPEATGTLGWVGEPFEASEDPGVWIARLVHTPFYSDSWPVVVHLGACEITPVATYEIRSTWDGVCFSVPLVIETIARPTPKYWADCVGVFDGEAWTEPNGVVCMDDVMAAVQKFRKFENAPHLTWVDIDGQEPNVTLNFADIQMIIQGFKGEPYPFADPAECP